METIMPTKSLSPDQAKMLTFAFYAVMFILCGITVWNSLKIADMPLNYVTIERHKEAGQHSETNFKAIDEKLTMILTRLK